jgi:hypothetical protein
MKPITQQKQLVDVREQAAMLSISTRHLHDLTRDRIVPSVRLGRALRYNPQAVIAALEANTANLLEAKQAKAKRKA